MNSKLSMPFLILIIAPFFFACRGPVTAENTGNAPVNPVSAGNAAVVKYNVDTKESVVTWKGSMLLGSNAHKGYIYISKGELLIGNGQFVGATVEVDMNTIEDENHRADNNLIDHLKNPDFFDVKKFPVSTITTTGVESTGWEDKKVTGNLTIKGITKPVSFPAKIEVRDGIVNANGRLVIDRTKWDVRYKSGKFYDLLADQTMSDSIEFRIKIVAKK